jgi:hypothetical protein
MQAMKASASVPLTKWLIVFIGGTAPRELRADREGTKKETGVENSNACGWAALVLGLNRNLLVNNLQVSDQ